MNAIVFGRDKGKRSEVYYLLGKYFCHEILFTFSLHYVDFFSSFTDDNMMPQAITLHDEFIIILSQYIVFINACHTLHAAHLVAR